MSNKKPIYKPILFITIMSHVKELNAAAKGACQAVKGASLMYFVNQLNKAAKKNEFIESTDIKALQKMYCQAFSRESFSLYDFQKDAEGRASYIKQSKKAPKEGLTILEEGERGFKYLQPISHTLCGFINAYKFICKPYAKELDAAEAEALKAEKKAAKDAMKAEKKAAQAAYNNGQIDFNTYKSIMNK